MEVTRPSPTTIRFQTRVHNPVQQQQQPEVEMKEHNKPRPDAGTENSENIDSCPVCLKKYPVHLLEEHANHCLDMDVEVDPVATPKASPTPKDAAKIFEIVYHPSRHAKHLVLAMRHDKSLMSSWPLGKSKKETPKLLL